MRSGNPLWSILHSPSVVFASPRFVVFVAYPLIPWIGVTAAGYGLGQIYSWHADRRRRFLLRMGIAMISGFVLLRYFNVYGDPSPWSAQKSAALTLVSFLNTTKYPPSLLFLLMTLGPALVVLALLDGRTSLSTSIAARRWFFGRVPMFYYLLHVPLIHLLATVVCYFRYGHVYWMFQSPDLGNFPISPPPGWGFPLPVTYLVWVCVVVALYPLCRWFADYKRRNSYAWLGYL